jgi:hypothetical protein
MGDARDQPAHGAQAVLAPELGFQLLPGLGHAVDGMADFSEFVVTFRKAMTEV